MSHLVVFTVCRLFPCGSSCVERSLSHVRVVLQGSQLQQQPALGQNTRQKKLQSLGPNLASVQLSARVAMVCLMHQLTALLKEKHAAEGDCHQELAQHRTAAGSCFSASWPKGAMKSCFYTAALKPVRKSLVYKRLSFYFSFLLLDFIF